MATLYVEGEAVYYFIQISQPLLIVSEEDDDFHENVTS
jgi:hypothetical protein